MNLREIYEIQLGNYKDKYMVTEVMLIKTDKPNATLRRVCMPKSKIDGVRLPNEISITFYGTPIPSPNKRKQSKPTTK